jgi:hypothetical protein
MSRAPKYHPDSNAYAMSSYLHYHPQVAQALELNPALSTDPTFLQSHPQFRAVAEALLCERSDSRSNPACADATPQPKPGNQSRRPAQTRALGITRAFASRDRRSSVRS